MREFLFNILGNVAGELVFAVIAVIATWLALRYRSMLESVAHGRLVKAPDGLATAFEANGDVFIAPVNGNVRNVTNSPARDYNAQWSLDGKILAFQSMITIDKVVLMVIRRDSAKPVILLQYPLASKLREFAWLTSGGLLIDMGGSQTVIKRDEIEKKLNGAS